jgi:hypothetical protein
VLVVRPEVGPLDPGAVTAWFRERLGRGAGAERIMALTWQQSGILEVVRRAPEITAAGKVLPVLRAAGRREGEVVGASRFERPTSCSQGRRATRLRHAPTRLSYDTLPTGAPASPKS